VRGSGLPQCAQKRAPSGFGRPHWLQWTLGIASPGLPSIGHAVGPGIIMTWLARGVYSGDAANATGAAA
jgi:hypothetical protein